MYFNVLANGVPYLLGNERFKGSHSMSGYHSTELCYLAAVYTNLLINKQPMDFYFKPHPDGFENRILRVAPDILPAGQHPDRRGLDRRRAVRELRRRRAPGHAAGNRPTRARQGAHRAGGAPPHTEWRGQARAMSPVQVSTRTIDGASVIRLDGTIDGSSAPAAQAAIVPLLAPGCRLVLDLTGVDFMSSAGLRLMLLDLPPGRRRRAARWRWSGLSEEIRDTMSLTGFLDFFTTARLPWTTALLGGRAAA